MRQSHYPREGYEPIAEAPAVSSLHDELPPEVIEYDKQIPLIAEPGTDRRRPAPPVSSHPGSDQDLLASETSKRPSVPVSTGRLDVPPSSKTSRPEYPPVHEKVAPVRRSPAASQPSYKASSVLGLSVPEAPEYETVPERPLETGHTRSEVRRMTEPPSTDFLDFSEPAVRSQDSLHGPSFLGLAADSPEYLDEEEPVSHARRNFALVVLALLVVLVALQWRSIRDFGLRYAQNGSVRVPGVTGGAPAADAENKTAVNGSAAAEGGTTDTGNGPNIEVAPAQNPNAVSSDSKPAEATKASEATPDAAQKAAESGSADEAGKTADAAAAPADPAAAPADPASDKPADSEATASAKGNVPDGEGDSEAAAEPPSEKPAEKSARSVRNAAARERQPIDDPSRFGATELAQANAAPDPATAATWLWKATAKGNWEAPVRLADMYVTGRGVSQDCDQALIILRSAAARKNARARSKLGSLYATGQCVEQDRVQAYHWMSLALQANPGSEWIDQNRQTLWSQMSADERRRAARDR